VGPRQALRAPVGDRAMLYAVGGIVALGLLVYLTVALLKPEIFQ
jgi:K+-transporting ATPase KdpF subunit